MCNDKGCISVVIPAHNAEKFILKAVRSVEKQSYGNWELLIVENGSTDNTYDLCLSLINDNRIRVYQSEKGVSNARNCGIKNANGKWIIFLDADDYLPDDAFENFIESVQDDTDLVVGDYDYISSNGKIERITDDSAFLKWCMINPTQYCNVTGNLFSLSFIKENKIFFDNELSNAEDSAFFISFICKMPCIIKMNKPVYHVYYNPASTVRTAKNNYVGNYINSIKKIDGMLSNAEKGIREAFDLFVLNQLLIISVHNIFAHISNFRQYKEACSSLKRLCSEEPFGSAVKNGNLRLLPKTKTVSLLLIKYKLYLGVFLIVKFRQLQNKRRQKSEERL